MSDKKKNNLTYNLDILKRVDFWITYPIALVFVCYSFFLISYRYVNYQYIVSILLVFIFLVCKTSANIQDEIFHIPQAQQYCNENFDYWDPKITTPPGLYVLAYIYKRILNTNPYGLSFECNIPILRSLNVFGGAFVFPVVVLVPIVLRYPYRLWVSNIVLTPLITIYFSLFYTDIWSTVLILASFVCCYINPFGFALSSTVGALLAFLSLWFRQTNIVWSAFNLVVLIDNEVNNSKNGYDIVQYEKTHPSLVNMFSILKQHYNTLYNLIITILIFIQTALSNILSITPFLLNFFLFALFLFINGGITFGDKQNHISTIHIPQVYYCLLFMALLGWPILISQQSLKKYIKFSFGSFLSLTRTLLIYIVMLYTVKKFTVVHPFLLADNRHYTFYIWKKIIKFNTYSRYALVPIYHFIATIVLQKFTLKADGQTKTPNSILIILAFVFCTCATLVPSPLFEPRYYILPYLYWRLLINISSQEQMAPFEPTRFVVLRALALEFIWFMALNTVVLYVFINFQFTWDSEPDVIQRIIW